MAYWVCSYQVSLVGTPAVLSPVLNVSLRRSRKMSIKHLNYVTTAYQIPSNSSFTSYPAILRYVACHTGRTVNSNVNNTVKQQTS
jgi:hypothetical protein